MYFFGYIQKYIIWMDVLSILNKNKKFEDKTNHIKNLKSQFIILFDFKSAEIYFHTSYLYLS
jgi:hypothetical protein